LSGVPVEQIAEQLNTKVERVRTWVMKGDDDTTTKGREG